MLMATAGAIYLHDPPWAGEITSGLRDWEEDPPGTRFRWTSGHSALFVPSDAASMTLAMRAVFPGIVSVDVSVDDRWLATVSLGDPDAWLQTKLPLPRNRSWRRYRRVDLHVSRTIGDFNLGVELGPIELQRP
jgi:hypothetical protein